MIIVSETVQDRDIVARSTPATMSKQRSTLSKQHSTLLPLPQTATMSNDSIVKFRPFDNVECCFDIVAKKGNNVEATFDIVQRIVQLVAFDNVASTLLLVWTGLNRKSLGAFRMAAIPMTLSDLEGHLCCLKPFLVLMSYTPGNAACIIFGRAYAYSPTLLASLQLPTSLVFIGC